MPSSSPASPDPPLRLAFGNSASDYERGRPEWPDEVAQVGGLPREAEVLDLGAGTGKLTRVLRRRFAGVTAVEPSDEMRARGALVLCCLWHDGGPYIPLPEAGWEIASRYRRPGVEPGGTILESGAWREPFDEPSSPFEPLQTESFAHVHVQTAEEVVARTLSTSVFAALSAEERRQLGDELRGVVPSVEYRTDLRAEVWWTRLR